MDHNEHLIERWETGVPKQSPAKQEFGRRQKNAIENQVGLFVSVLNLFVTRTKLSESNGLNKDVRHR